MSKALTIGVDIRDLRVSKTGIRTYLDELCREFKNLQSPELRFYFLDSSLPIYKGNNRLLKLAEHAKYQLWKQVGLPLKAALKGCDIVFCTDNFVPLLHLGYQTIPVFHDAFFFENPENYGKLWLWLYKKTALPAAKNSPYVITPSYYAQKQIHHFTGIAIEKLKVIYEAPGTAEVNIVSNNAASVIEKHSLKANAYLLHVGAMFKRKNLPFLIEAFSLLKTDYPDLKLVLAGPILVSAAESDFENIQRSIQLSGFEHYIILPGYLPTDELTALYQSAALYVFPSVNEGFGIPVLEAFKYQLPILVADNTCLPEVGGDAAISFNPFEVDDLAAKIKLVLENQAIKNEMIAKGSERLKEFSWNKAALQLVDIFKQAAKKS